MGKRKSEFRRINRRHKLCRACFFSQRRFRRRFDIKFPIGLCAGLVQVWWDELKRGRDGIHSFRDATSSLILNVLLSQARSIYLREFPRAPGDLTEAESELLKLKYGTAAIGEIRALQDLFGAGDALDLDIVLQHESPLLAKDAFLNFGPEVADAMTGSPGPGLSLMLIRHKNQDESVQDRGHRMALAFTRAGSCLFYDPSVGEMKFPAAARFAGWFEEYWKAAGWESRLRPARAETWPIRVFRLGESLGSPQAQRAAELKRNMLIAEPNSRPGSPDIEGLIDRIRTVISLCAT